MPRYGLDPDSLMRKLKACSAKVRSASIPPLVEIDTDEELTETELDALERALGYRLHKLEE